MAPTDSTKKVLEDFIEIYKMNPCLWQVKNKEYHDRDKKEAAYKLLIEKLREIEPDANKSVVVRKINNLRSNVRKEKKRYEQSVKSGASADEVYHVKLWYYDLFDFLHDQCTPRESSSNLDSDEDSCEGYLDQQNSSNGETTNNTEVQSRSSNNYSSRPPKPDKAKRKDESITNELLESVRDHFKRPREKTEDRCDIIAKNIAIKLRALDGITMCVAEKIMNDLLFEAEIGHLTPDHAYINMRDILRQHQRSYVPAQQYQQQVHYQSSPISNKSYASSFVSSGSPSPPCFPLQSGQHSQQIYQLLPPSHLNNSQQADTYSIEMQTPTVQVSRDETVAVPSIPGSTATFINNFTPDTV